jgi:putative DNA primase/helicase
MPQSNVTDRTVNAITFHCDGQSEMIAFAQAALWYAVHGWKVFPLKTRTKQPATAHGFKDATTDAEQIAAWWRKMPDANIGMATGAIVVVDFDTYKPDFAGTDLLEFLERNYPTVRADAHGAQLFYQQPADMPQIRNSSGDLPAGVDVRGHGGYTVLAPSAHPDGYTYRWGDGRSPADMEPAILPAFLADMILKRDNRQERSEPAEDTTIAAFNAKFSIVGILRKHDYTLASERGDFVRLSRPGRDAEQSSITVTRLDGKERSYHHSTSDKLHTDGFARDAFDCFTMLEHGGDAKAAYKAAKKLLGTWQEPTDKKPAKPAPIFHTNGSTTAVHTNGSTANGATAPLANVGATNGAAAFDFSGFQTDAGNAQRFAAQHAGALRYTQAHGWLHWDGKRWKPDETGEVFRLARRTVAAMMRDAQSANEAGTRAMEAIAKRMEAGEDAEDPTPAIKAAQKRANELQKWAVKSQSKERLKAMVELAQSEPGIASHAADFDRDPWLLNVQNGILDLRTGELSPHDPAAMMTQLAGATYDPDAPCPRWTAFLAQVQPDPDVRMFLQRSIGYALTGSTPEQVFWDFYGTGANGKSVMSGIVLAMLGDYGMRARAQTFMVSKQAQSGANASEDVAQLAGKRLVLASELEDSQKLAESLIKDLTGGDRLRARFLHKNSFEFQPMCKIWLVGNHKPIVVGTDLGIWRRVRLVPFDVTISQEDQDAALTDKLLSEIDGLLAWAVRGCLDWQRDGLATPQAVTLATNGYQKDSDFVGQWLAERTTFANATPVPINTSAERLFKDYKQWCESSGLNPMTKPVLGRRLVERGLKSNPTNKGMVYLNIALLAPEEPEKSEGSEGK